MAGFPSLLYLNNIPLYIYHILFIPLSIDGRLGCFQTLAIVNNAAMNMGVQSLFRDSDSISSRLVPRSGIAGSYGSSILMFLRRLHTVFPSWLHQFTSCQQCTRVPFSLHPHQHLLSLVFLIIVVLTGVR